MDNPSPRCRMVVCPERAPRNEVLPPARLGTDRPGDRRRLEPEREGRAPVFSLPIPLAVTTTRRASADGAEDTADHPVLAVQRPRRCCDAARPHAFGGRAGTRIAIIKGLSPVLGPSTITTRCRARRRRGYCPEETRRGQPPMRCAITVTPPVEGGKDAFTQWADGGQPPGARRATVCGFHNRPEAPSVAFLFGSTATPARRVLRSRTLFALRPR